MQRTLVLAEILVSAAPSLSSETAPLRRKDLVTFPCSSGSLSQEPQLLKDLLVLARGSNASESNQEEEEKEAHPNLVGGGVSSTWSVITKSQHVSDRLLPWRKQMTIS